MQHGIQSDLAPTRRGTAVDLLRRLGQPAASAADCIWRLLSVSVGDNAVSVIISAFLLETEKGSHSHSRI